MILVLGGNGLVGKHLQDYIKNNQDWIFVSSKDGDLTCIQETKALFIKYKPTIVLNLAAYVGGLYKNMKENVEFFNNNMLITMNVMYCCYEFKVNKLVSVMSTCIFPAEIDSYPISEKNLHNGVPHFSNMGYSYAKRCVDILSQCYNNEYDTNFVTVILGNIYGKHDHFNQEGAHVIPDLISQFRNNDIPVIKGSGKALRQFTHADDIAKLLHWVIFNYNDKSEGIILSTEEEVSIEKVVNILKKKYNRNNVIYDLSFHDGQYKKTVTNKKLKSYIPSFEFITIEHGLTNLID